MAGEPPQEQNEPTQDPVEASADAPNDEAPSETPSTPETTAASEPQQQQAPNVAEPAAASAESGDESDDASEPVAAQDVEPDVAADAPASDGAMPLDLPDLTARSSAGDMQGLELLHDVELNVKIELGRAEMYIEDVLKLGEGSVVELDKLAGDPVDVLVNDRLVARGEVLVLNDNFCVRINDIVAHFEEEGTE